MAALKVKLVKGLSGRIPKHRQTLRGMGLTRVGKERILPDTPATRGMISQVGYLLEWSETNEAFKPFGRKATQAKKA